MEQQLTNNCKKSLGSDLKKSSKSNNPQTSTTYISYSSQSFC